MTSYKLVDFKTLGDERGSLIAIEEGYNAPFQIKRVYYIFDTKEAVERGFHAHINLKQICTGWWEKKRRDNPNQGLFIEGLIWREMKNFSSDCVLVVLASEHYDESDYIRDYDKFLEVAKSWFIN